MKKLVELLAPLWLGFSLAHFGNISFLQWQFYAIVIPFFILVKITDFNKNNE